MTAKDWITLALAAVGAMTGLFSLGWNVATYLLRDRPRLTLRHSVGYALLPPPFGEGYIVTITAANQTRHAVVVESVGFQLSDGNQMALLSSPGYQPPYEVKPGGKYEAIAKLPLLQAQLAKMPPDVRIVGVWANDAVGKRWKGKVPKKWDRTIRTYKA